MIFPAIEVYSHIEDIGMVLSLKSLKYVEDKKLISGHVCKFLGQFDQAQVFGIRTRSSCTIRGSLM